jgi:hypothetical protein
VTATCRECGVDFPTKALVPGEGQRFGLCPFHAEAAERHLAELSQVRTEPPKSRKKKDAKVIELHPPRRIWEPN